jgi:hypothetical protein
MTLNELCGCEDPSVYEKMTDAELLELFKPVLNVTRPEQAKLLRTNKLEPQPVYITPAKRKALAAAQEAGIDLSFMYQRKRR